MDTARKTQEFCPHGATFVVNERGVVIFVDTCPTCEESLAMSAPVRQLAVAA